MKVRVFSLDTYMSYLILNNISYFSLNSMSSPLFFHRTQCPLSLFFIEHNVLVFILHSTQCPLSLGFQRTQRPRLYFSQDSTSSVFSFHWTQHPMSLFIIGLSDMCISHKRDFRRKVFALSPGKTFLPVKLLSNR